MKVQDQLDENTQNEDWIHQIRKTMTALSIHGIKNYSQSKNRFIKILWLVTLIAMFNACFVSIYQTILTYTNRETFTKLETMVLNETKFPGITFCNRNQSLNISEMLLECKINSKLNCSASDFIKTHVFEGVFDTCYTLNMFNKNDDRFRAYYKKSMISLDLFTGLNDDLQMDESGIRVIISNQDKYNDFDEGFDINGGKFLIYLNDFFYISLNKIQFIFKV